MHKRVSSSGYQQIQGDLEVQGNLLGPTVTGLASAIAKLSATSTTPVKLAAPVAEGQYRTVILRWTRQYNLSNLDYYMVQVSEDDLVWYSLSFDGSTWGGDSFGGTTRATVEMIVHPNIPLLGTVDAPTGRTLHYRVCQYTKAGVQGAWSDSVSAMTKTVQAGDLGANSVYANQIVAGTITADKLLATDINTMLLRATAAVIIGYAGTGTNGAPAEGDRRAYIDEDELGLEVYTNGAWATARSIKLGGVDTNGNFLPFLSCRGLLGDMSVCPTGDPVPDSTFYHFGFDDTLEDQDGTDPWTVAAGTVGYSASPKWEGTKALKANTDDLLSLDWVDIWTPGNSFTVAGMFYRTSTASSSQLSFFSDANNYIVIGWTSASVVLTVKKGGVLHSHTDITYNAAIDTWILMGAIYDSATNTIYARFGNFTMSFQPAGTWGATPGDLEVYAAKSSEAEYIDDLIFSPTVAIDPEIFLQHSQRGIAWTTDFTALDVFLKAQAGGSIRLLSPTAHYAPVASEPSLGTPHPHIYQFSANLFSNTAPGAATFLTVTVAGLPVGTKAIEIVGYIVNGAAGEECRWRPYGSADTSAQSAHRMLGLRPAGGTAYCGIRGMVTVDMSGRFDICVTDANDDIYIRGYSIYWI
jgi:hypothetical protein